MIWGDNVDLPALPDVSAGGDSGRTGGVQVLSADPGSGKPDAAVGGVGEGHDRLRGIGPFAVHAGAERERESDGRLGALSHLEGRLLKWLCERPAAFAGLQSRKGSLAPGYQCDLCIFRPDMVFQVGEEELKFKNKISAYLGKRLTGRVVSTVLATQLVYNLDHPPAHPENRPGRLLLN
ncbi:uncharacterized protein VP01_588g6 [Puccinia sorghi]|uniref:Uncharacterized protein n=1 Tax=Puccinia sorghi TaxID=27349 RepID=A0A0L6UJY2_9BASI|nr:uncharacterized protein VP01_588g6 [Puccinia sorghi]